MAERPSFLADEMLGSLARWLRIMGYDTEYARNLPDSEILLKAKRESRVLLTRDRQLAERAGERGLLVEGEDLDAQLRQVVDAFGLVFDEPMTRCTICNGELIVTDRKGVECKVPARVLERHDQFFVCPRCGQIYWKGTHWSKINERLDRAIKDHSL